MCPKTKRNLEEVSDVMPYPLLENLNIVDIKSRCGLQSSYIEEWDSIYECLVDCVYPVYTCHSQIEKALV